MTLRSSLMLLLLLISYHFGNSLFSSINKNEWLLATKMVRNNSFEMLDDKSNMSTPCT